jgi:integrase
MPRPRNNGAANYIEQRRRLFYAVLDVPTDVRQQIGRRRFVQSLKTDSRAIAERRAARLVQVWRVEIAKARQRRGTLPADAVEADARFWRDALKRARTREEAESIREEIADRADALDTAPATATTGPEAATRFFAVATGKVQRTKDHIDGWIASIKGSITDRSLDMRESSVRRLAQTFPTLDAINRKAVNRWAEGLLRGNGASAALSLQTVRRTIGECRSFWRYLLRQEIVTDPDDTGVTPFDKLDFSGVVGSNGAGKSPRTSYVPFEPADVVRLRQEAERRGDQQIADLITICMWTGCRLEEAAALKVSKVTLKGTKGSWIDIEEAKTAAGWRRVPIHSKLYPAFVKLAKDSTDDYVLSGLDVDSYGRRGTMIGKRFGRLKTKLGFGPLQVFHSIRKTVVTILENAGVPEGVVADIVGHEKQTMTYGLYSGGATIETKRAAIEKLRYAT